jgi:hypothetical protein
VRTWTSKPAVKARSPAPVRTMERTLGSWESLMKILERLCHMLFAWVSLVVSEGIVDSTFCHTASFSFDRHGELRVMLLPDVEFGMR